MSKHRKTWTQPQIEEVLAHYQQHGIAATVRQFNVSSAMVYRWLANQQKQHPQEAIAWADYHHLLRQNQALKELVAEKELEIRVKDALLKKTTLTPRSG